MTTTIRGTVTAHRLTDTPTGPVAKITVRDTVISCPRFYLDETGLLGVSVGDQVRVWGDRRGGGVTARSVTVYTDTAVTYLTAVHPAPGHTATPLRTWQQD